MSSYSFSTGWRSGDSDGHGETFILFSVTHFCVDFDVCFWIIVLIEDPTLVRIHDAMYLNIYPGPPAEK